VNGGVERRSLEKNTGNDGWKGQSDPDGSGEKSDGSDLVDKLAKGQYSIPYMNFSDQFEVYPLLTDRWEMASIGRRERFRSTHPRR